MKSQEFVRSIIDDALPQSKVYEIFREELVQGNIGQYSIPVFIEEREGEEVEFYLDYQKISEIFGIGQVALLFLEHKPVVLDSENQMNPYEELIVPKMYPDMSEESLTRTVQLVSLELHLARQDRPFQEMMDQLSDDLVTQN